MKTRRIPLNTKPALAMILVLSGLLTWPGIAGSGELDEQLIGAANTGDSERVKDLLEKGVSVDAKDRNGQTPLMRASLLARNETMKLLLEKGADINARDNGGRTALMWAVWSGHLEVVQLLLQRGADVNVKSFAGKTALLEASARNHHIEDNWYFGLWSLIQPILRRSFFGPARPYDGQDAAIVALLLQKGADVNVRDAEGWTALKRAQYRGAMDIAGVLRAHGAKE